MLIELKELIKLMRLALQKRHAWRLKKLNVWMFERLNV